MTERISVDPQICHGQVCIKETRIPVHQIIHMLANGDKVEELLQDYPSLRLEDIYACLDYAASLTEEQITPIDMLENAALRERLVEPDGRHAGYGSKHLEV